MTTATATVLFCDVADSTGHRARLGEVEADRLFRAHEQLLRDLVGSRGGRVLKGAGDGVMAVFSAASDGAAAAVAIQQGVSAETPELRVRVGVAAGDVSWEGDDCFGLPVVVAARLESVCEPGGILVSAVVRYMAGDRTSVVYSPVGALELKGIPDPVDAFSVAWETADSAVAGWQFPATLPSASRQPFVGRATEQGELEQAWSEVVAGHHGVVLVGGEAGAGKTRLATELARRCHQEGAIVLCGLCDSELSLPYQPWVMALDELVGQLPERALDTLRDDLSHLQVLVPRVERLVSGLKPPDRLEPEAERHRMFTAAVAVLRAAAELSPIMLVLEDLHWAGPQTLALLRFAARAAPIDRLFIVGTFRDTGDEITDPLASVLADLRRVDSVSRVKLAGIGVEAVLELLAAAGSVGDLRARAVAITERTAGNPFLVSELSLDSDQSAGESVPNSVMDVVTGRLNRLTESARRLSTFIAIAGRVELAVLRDSATVPVDELGTSLSELIQTGLVQELTGPIPTYQFAHALIRDAVSSSLPAFSRSEVHHSLALALERAHEADRRLMLAELARHFAAAAPVAGWEKAAYYGRRAASQARRTAAYQEAIEILELTLDVVPDPSTERAELLIDVADLLEHCGRNPEAVTLAEKAYETAREIGDLETQARAATEFERATHLQNRPTERAVSILEAVLRSSEELPAESRARLRGSLGRAKTLVGHVDAPEVVSQALDEARKTGDEFAVSHTLEVACVTETDPLARLDLCTELEGLSAGTGNVFQSMWALARHGQTLLTLGRLAEAESALERLQSRADSHRFPVYQYEVKVLASNLALAAGDLDAAERAAEAAGSAEQSSALGIESSGVYGVQMFMIRREQGRLDEMRPILQMLDNAATAAGIWRPGLIIAFAELGMVDEARAGFEDLASDGFSKLPHDSVRPLALSFLSDACTILGDETAATTLLEALGVFAGYALDAGWTATAGPADRCRAAMAELCGRRENADEYIRDAASMAVSSGSPVWQAHVEHTWAWMAARRGDDEGVAAHFVRARALADEFVLGSIPVDPPQPILPSPDAEMSKIPLLPDGLSGREAEVLALLAMGQTNRSIAETLFISPNTAANHVRSILQKSGSANRTEAAAYAVRHGLNTSSK